MKSMNLIRKFVLGAALGLAVAVAPVAANAGVFISVGFAPPALPVYTQPVCPGDGYLWNPGYWAYGPEGYYWVPGVWVQPPTVGLLWTPGYWGWGGSAFIFHEGYWGPHVGFYGGINYGFGYGGVGFVGGRWDGGHFAYNTAVVNVNRTVIHNTYVENVHVNNTTYSHTSFNGGTGGVPARPTAQEAQFEHENHVPPTSAQMSHVQAAHAEPGNFAKANGGHPAMAAIQRPGAMNTAVPARGATVNQRAGSQAASGGRFNGQQLNQHGGSNAQRPATAAAPATRTGGFGQTAPRPAETQAQSRPQTQARPAAQSRPQAAPRAQAPKPANHGGEHPHR
ncbi:hypothetical protein [Granulicella aggregans]|uniref:hypothetical protein n=1 Tax=Granulicella aggregans TaxID=474949 RepID=UPI0021E04465|nr:hypothetical protein [Granulicella aggregans]